MMVKFLMLDGGGGAAGGGGASGVEPKIIVMVIRTFTPLLIAWRALWQLISG